MPIPLRQEFRVPGLNEPISHYTDAVRFGTLLFVSGIGPLAEDGSLVGPNDAAEQTRQSLRNLDKVLRAAGASPADGLKVDRLGQTMRYGRSLSPANTADGARLDSGARPRRWHG